MAVRYTINLRTASGAAARPTCVGLALLLLALTSSASAEPRDACANGTRYRGSTIDASAAAYRRALDPATSAASLLGPVEAWHASSWPHLLWLC